jgi:calcineurin-like phosphoesterase family protein
MKNNRRRWWIITDTHFGHDRIIQLSHRPENYNELIFKSWQNNVEPDDWVIHLGDVTWPKYYDKIKELPGHKILCRGNHDQKSYTWFQEHGFDLVCEEFTMKYDGLNIVFSHQPLIFHDKDINIHGHLHNMVHRNYSDFINPDGGEVSPLFCISLEMLGYQVFSLDYILKLAKKELVNNNTMDLNLEAGEDN